MESDPLLDFYDLRGRARNSSCRRQLTLEHGRTPINCCWQPGSTRPVKHYSAGPVRHIPAQSYANSASPHPLLVAEFEPRTTASAVSADPASHSFHRTGKVPGVSTRDIAMFVPHRPRQTADLEAFFRITNRTTIGIIPESSMCSSKTTQSVDAGQARKSIAYSLTYRDESRTLQSNEIDDAHGRVLEALKQALPVEIR